jgi:hypothetical protein
LLVSDGEACLPVILFNGQVALQSRYPERSELAELLKLNISESSSTSESSCCGGSSCCS